MTRGIFKDSTIVGMVVTAGLSLIMAGNLYAVSLQKQIKITTQNLQLKVNGKQVALKDNAGNTVEPFYYNGTLYIPAESLSAIKGITLAVNEETNTLSINSKAAGSQALQGDNGEMPPEPPSGESNGPRKGGFLNDAESALKKMVAANTITQEQMDKALVSLKKSTANGRPVQGADPFTALTNDGILTAEQAATLKENARPPKGGPGGMNNMGNPPQGENGSEEMGNPPEGQGGPGDMGNPPEGQGGPEGMGAPSDSPTVIGTAAYSQEGQTAIKTAQSLAATKENQSVARVSNKGVLEISDSILSKTGDTSSGDESNFFGLNAAVLAESGSQINIKNCTINTKAEGSNAIFATGEGSVITISNATIKTFANSSRGLDATLTGTINATDVVISTQGAHCAALATDRGCGTVTVKGGTMTTAGEGSPAIYSTGAISAANARMHAYGSEAAVIEGKNSITLNNVDLYGEEKCGVMLYQSFSGDAEVGTSIFSMAGGSLTAAKGPLFYTTNTQCEIKLKGAKLSSQSGVLISAKADRWGTSGSNGSDLKFSAEEENLAGNVTCDGISTITMNLNNNTSLKGEINSAKTAKFIHLALDNTSKWEVTGDSYLTSFEDEDSTLANIKDNGHTIYYHADEETNSAWLQGKTYALPDGGKLVAIL
jgi:hypothetical protein